MNGPRECEVLVEGRWIRGWLHHWYRDPKDHAWRGVVQYTTSPGMTYCTRAPLAGAPGPGRRRVHGN